MILQDYLVRWRIQSAARILRSSDRTVASVAAQFGYTSESAFSNAFKRVTGQSPARHRRIRPWAGSAAHGRARAPVRRPA
jgi:AraC-like DNA-binding protein